MIQLNLLPDIKKEVILAQRMHAKVITGAVTAVAVTVGMTVIAAIYVYAVQPLQVYMANDSISKNRKEIEAQKDISKYLSLQNQLNALPSLHSEKTRDSLLMSFLPILNPGAPHQVRLSSVILSEDNQTVVLSGQTSTFEALTVFKDTLRLANLTYTPIEEGAKQQTEKLFTDVAVQNQSLSRSGAQQIVAFTIQATYSQNAFSSKVKDAQVSVPNVSNAQSADQTTNKSVFEQVTGQ